MNPTQSELMRLFRYEPDTGRLVRLVSRGRAVAGSVAGTRRKTQGGRTLVLMNGKQHAAARLIWCLVTGSWPTNHIDHIDGDPSNDKWDNLREANRCQNQWNRGVNRNNKTGLKGVTETWGGWRARIRANGKTLELGKYATPIEAHQAYLDAAKIHHGEFRKKTHP